jgi:hypothetical protein
MELLDVRDATAKEIYDRLFSWLFKKANELLSPAIDVTAGIQVPLGVLGEETGCMGWSNLPNWTLLAP